MTLRLGFVPLTDSAPLLMAQSQGFFADEGLDVELVREVSWATVRDKVAVGALDAAHMLAPMVIAATLGVGSEPAELIAPIALSRNGAGVTLSTRIAAAIGEGPRGQGLKRLIGRRQEQGASALTFAVVFPYSIHNYLLRAWLSAAGVDPDADVRLTVAAPSRMAELLAGGVIEGFSAGEPWTTAAERQGAGEIAVRAADLWPTAPDKVLGMRREWAEADTGRLQALLRALVRGAAWADAPGNRAALADLLAAPQHVGLPADLLSRGIEEIVFHARGANAPRLEDARWLVEQMMSWGQLAVGDDAAVIAARVYRPDLFAQALGATSA